MKSLLRIQLMAVAVSVLIGCLIVPCAAVASYFYFEDGAPENVWGTTELPFWEHISGTSPSGPCSYTVLEAGTSYYAAYGPFTDYVNPYQASGGLTLSSIDGGTETVWMEVYAGQWGAPGELLTHGSATVSDTTATNVIFNLHTLDYNFSDEYLIVEIRPTTGPVGLWWDGAECWGSFSYWYLSPPPPFIYIDFDPPLCDHWYWPDPYEEVLAYVCLQHMGDGMTAVSFKLSDPMVDCPGVFDSAEFTSLLPGGIAVGDVFTGITLTSTECVSGWSFCVGYLSLYYLGGACCLEILDHPEYPRWVVDCQEPPEVEYYCVWANGSIGGAPCPDGDCALPVRAKSWGQIKAMYR